MGTPEQDESWDDWLAWHDTGDVAELFNDPEYLTRLEAKGRAALEGKDPEQMETSMPEPDERDQGLGQPGLSEEELRQLDEGVEEWAREQQRKAAASPPASDPNRPTP
jgi:hypothetical protein